MVVSTTLFDNWANLDKLILTRAEYFLIEYGPTQVELFQIISSIFNRLVSKLIHIPIHNKIILNNINWQNLSFSIQFEY